MLWAILIILCSFCNAQEYDDSYNETDDGIEDIKCIGQYIDLEMYVLNNKILMEKIAEAFFTTGSSASTFVKITYNFQTSNSRQFVEDNITNCYSQQSAYIWSETAVYLLGPAMYWCTLFAVKINPVDVTIDLPCFCDDAYSSLLSRLTYLIKVYAATKYHDHPLQFVNKYYFQVKSTVNDENYKRIIIIMAFIAVLPLTMTFVVSYLTVLHIKPIVRRLKKINKVTVSTEDYSSSTAITGKPKTEKFDKRLVHEEPLIFTSVGISIGFLTIHVISVVKLIQYGEEVLSFETYHNKMPIVHAIFSLLGIVIGFVITQIILFVNSKNDNKENQELRLPMAVVSVNIIYIGCYFLLYMLLAFIHNPLLTMFTYFMVILLVACVYLICLGAWSLHDFFIRKYSDYPDSEKCTKLLSKFLHSCMAWAMAFSIIMFVFVMIYIMTLGSLDDFEELKDLAPSLLIGVVGLFLLKPTGKFLTDKLKCDSNDDKNEGKEEIVQGNNGQPQQRDPKQHIAESSTLMTCQLKEHINESQIETKM